MALRGAVSKLVCIALRRPVARLMGALLFALLLALALGEMTSGASRRACFSSAGASPAVPVWLGNPIAGEAYSARHISDLQVWRGRVYLGYGDWTDNLGPVDIWYYAPDEGCFFSETVYVDPTRPFARVDEEAIDRYVVIDGELYIPGTDPRPPDSWDLGNFYRNGGGGWMKHRTIPYGVHAFDMAGYDGELFVAIGPDNDAGLLRSADGGFNWTPAISETSYTRFYELYTLSGALFAIKSPTTAYTKPVLYRYESPRFVTTTVSLVPDRQDDVIFIRDETFVFSDVVLYVPSFYDVALDCLQPITALYQARVGEDGQHVPFFDGKYPRDVVVNGGWVYVLDAGGPRCLWDTQPPATDGYTATVYASTDLATWIPMATGHFTDTPNALEVLNGVAYVGTYNGDIYALPLHHLYLAFAARDG